MNKSTRWSCTVARFVKNVTVRGQENENGDSFGTMYIRERSRIDLQINDSLYIFSTFIDFNNLCYISTMFRQTVFLGDEILIVLR